MINFMKLRYILPLIFIPALLISCTEKAEEPEYTNSAPESIYEIRPQKQAGPDQRAMQTDEVGENIAMSRQNAITKAVERISPAVVGIIVTEIDDRMRNDPFFNFFMNPGGQREFTSRGSGFIISADGHVVTNEHVIGRNPTSIQIVTADGNTYDAEVVGSDEYTDLALLKIKSESRFPTVEFGDSDDAIAGEWVIAVGNPFGIFQDGQPTVTVGVISALQRNFRPNPQDPRVYLNMIQTDAAINRGNSGGPLVNANGQVIGINTFIYTGGTGSGFVGLSFAIPSNRAIQIIQQLAESGEIPLDYDPGMEVVSINRRLAYDYRLPYMQGLLVVTVNQDGPAYEAGILPGDIITRFGDELIYGQTHAMALLREYNEGDEMRMEIIRNNNLYETEMKLRKRAIP